MVRSTAETVGRFASAVGVFGILFPLFAICAPARAEPRAPRVRIETSEGPLTVELYADRAPRTAERFLARAGLAAKPEGVVEVAPYAGLSLCESRAHGFLVFGCLPYDPSLGEVPRAPRKEPPQDDEIDATAMGLDRVRIAGIPERDWLWQREILPRAWKLEEAGRPVPPGLRALVEAAKREGTKAWPRLDGMSRLAYLEAIGYQFRPGTSPHALTRGALATANFWPGEADERFLLALADLPDRSGRATVLGRVVDGWATLDAIARIPVDKGHRPRKPVTITGMEFVR